MDAKFFAGIACPLATDKQLSRSFPEDKTMKTDTAPCGATAALNREQNEIDVHAEAMRLYEVVARDELSEYLNGNGFADLLDFMDDEWADLKIQTKFKAAFDQADALEMGGLVMDAFDRAEKAAVESEWGQAWIKGRAVKLYYEEDE